MAQRAEEWCEGPGRERAERVAVGQHRGADPARVAAQHDLADRPAGVVADEGHVAEVKGREEVGDERGDPLRREVSAGVHRGPVGAEGEGRRIAADAFGREALGDRFPEPAVGEQSVHQHDRPPRTGPGGAVGERALRQVDRGEIGLRMLSVHSKNIHSDCMYVET